MVTGVFLVPKYLGELLTHVQFGAEGRGVCVCVSDLWSRAEQLLVFKSQSLFLQLQLLQSHLVVPSHDGRVLGAGGELGALFYRRTLGNSLLVQSYTQEDIKKKKRRDLHF